MSDAVLEATIGLRGFLFEAVYENETATAEFKKAAGVLGGLWEKVRERPEEFLDLRTIEHEGLDAAARDFIAGMTDRYRRESVRATVRAKAVGLAPSDSEPRLPRLSSWFPRQAVYPIPAIMGGSRWVGRSARVDAV